MTSSKSLPPHPSLQSLRKQAKKLARDAHPPMSQRDAQLMLAREYGFAGWQDLTAEVSKRLGNAVEWAVAQARRAIHDNDIERLRQLVAEYPAVLSWRGDGEDDGLLGMATSSYGNSFDPDRERRFTRAACAELLIDAGAVMMPSVFESVIESRATGLLRLFERKGLLPRMLRFLAALGDLHAVRAALEKEGNDPAAVNEVFVIACRFRHEAVASLLLERAIALRPDLGRQIDERVGRGAFIEYLIAEQSLKFAHAAPDGPWQAFVMEQVMRAVQDADLTAFVGELQREPWLLGDANVPFQIGIIERATLRDREEIITSLLGFDPALLRRQPPPPSQAIEFAFVYAKPHLIPVLTRIWAVPDDLPHAAGSGNLSRVKRWLDGSGAPAQQVLDTALAWSVINSHFEVADFLLQRGADINTRWGSHEPASILHELAGLHKNYEAMRFLIDRGIDMTIRDYRWNATAAGWARYAANDEAMARWLEEAERQR